MIQSSCFTATSRLNCRPLTGDLSCISDSLSQCSLNDDCGDDDWDDLDDTFTADYSSDDDARSVLSDSTIPVTCVALYDFDVCILSLMATCSEISRLSDLPKTL